MLKTKPKISYWVILPQGVKTLEKDYTSYSAMMVAKTFKQALKLLKKYNAPMIEVIETGKTKRVCSHSYYLHGKSYEELYDEYSKLPQIVIDKRI